MDALNLFNSSTFQQHTLPGNCLATFAEVGVDHNDIFHFGFQISEILEKK